MTAIPAKPTRIANSSQLASAIAAADFSGCAATVVGYGGMGRQFVKALQRLGVRNIRVCSRTAARMAELESGPGITLVPGDYSELRLTPLHGEAAIVCLPIHDLVSAARHLADLGYRKILIEKPVSLWSFPIEQLTADFDRMGVDATCGYNRIAYPAFHEAQARSAEEGGITSCTYTFTEFISRLDPSRYTPGEMERWGIANSLHVMSMAHGLIGLPAEWHGFRTGSAVSWHPAGSVFAGAGLSSRDVPFTYHADWGSTGRWSVEIHTKMSSYRLCPLEKLFRRVSATGDWDEVPLVTVADDIKTGFLEQVAAMLDDGIRAFVPLLSLGETLELTRFGEDVFGYGSRP